MEPVNKAILAGLSPALDSNAIDTVIISSGIYCATNESRLKVAIYRFSVVAPNLGVDWEAVQRRLQIWALTESEVKLYDGTAARIDSTCNTNITSLNDPLCSLVPTTLPLMTPEPGPLIGGGGVAAIVVSLLLAALVCVCVLLLILLYRTYKKTMQ